MTYNVFGGTLNLAQPNPSSAWDARMAVTSVYDADVGHLSVGCRKVALNWTTDRHNRWLMC